MTDPRVAPITRDDAILKFRLLRPYRRLEALRIACDDALAIWRRYCAAGSPIEYRDSIVNMRHTVDDTLPARALADVDLHLAGGAITGTVSKDYVEPVVSMHDNDLDFPDPIELAYYAIYNLHGLVTSSSKTLADEELVIHQVSNAVEVSPDDWARDWWTRIWDAWATRPDPAYEAAPVSAFDALSTGDLTAALTAAGGLLPLDAYPTPASGLYHAILLAFAARVDRALAAISIATGADLRDPAIAAWLTEHLYELVPEALAVSPDRQRYAAIAGDWLVIREVRTGAPITTTQYPSHRLRFARFISDESLYIAGDYSDDIGVHASFFSHYLDWRSNKHWDEHRGRRTLAAVGQGCFVAQHAREVIVTGANTYEIVGHAPVVAAAISIDGRCVATHDGALVTIWDRDRDDWRDLESPAVPLWLEKTAAPLRLAIAGGKLFVTWANHTASLHDLVAGR